MAPPNPNQLTFLEAATGGVLRNFSKFHGKTPVPEPLF